MKIVCDSCGAKYSIADEKVAGKVFKIRCKKCGAIIVVRGDQVATQEEEAAPVQEPVATDAIWHVVVDGDQQGPFAPDQVAELMTAGTIDWESYVWREGFEGWLAARDVPELIEAISGPPEGEAPAETGGEQAPESSMGADPFAATPGQAEGFADTTDSYPADAEAAASAEAEGGGAAGLFSGVDAGFGGGPASGGDADLFGQGAADMGGSPFEAGAAPDDDVVASSPGPRVSAEQAAMTGQRNENSVLFSLSNLQALATGSGGSTPPAAAASGSLPPMAGQATGEGSGLIDIRALASTGGAAGSMPPTHSDSGVDDLLSIGTGSPLGGSALGAPVLAPVQEEKTNKGLIYALVAAAAVLGVAVIAMLIILVTQEPEPVVAAADVTGEIQAPVQPPGSVDPAAAAPTPTEPEAGSDTEIPSAATKTGSSTTGSRTGSSRSGSRRRTGSRPSTSGSSTATPAPTPMTTTMRRGSDLDNLLDQALGGGGATPMRATKMASAMAASSNLPDTPPRNAVRAGLQSVQGAVRACGQGQHGTATTAITIRGSTGRVTSARVSGQFQGTPVGSCVARAVRGARFPRFSRDTFNVTFPFRL